MPAPAPPFYPFYPFSPEERSFNAAYRRTGAGASGVPVAASLFP